MEHFAAKSTIFHPEPRWGRDEEELHNYKTERCMARNIFLYFRYVASIYFIEHSDK